MKVIIMLYTKKILFRTNGPFWARKWIGSGLVPIIFLKFCKMKGANRYMKILLVITFRKKNYFGQFNLFRSFFTVWLDMVELEPGHCYLNSQAMIFFMITTGSLNSQDMIRIFKQSRHDLSGKHLSDGYCMDTRIFFIRNLFITN